MKQKHKLKDVSAAILGKYVTLTGKLATVDLYFDTFEELIDRNVGDNSVEMMNGALSEKLNDIFAMLPPRYEVFVRLHFGEMGDYGSEEAEQVIKDNFVLKIYSLVLERRKKTAKALSLLGGGIVILLVSYFLGSLDWPQIVFDVINISGTLFVWEAANAGLLERNAEAKIGRRYLKKFKGFSVVS